MADPLAMTNKEEEEEEEEALHGELQCSVPSTLFIFLFCC